MKGRIEHVCADQFTQFEELLELLRGSFAYMDGRIDPPSSLHTLDEEKIRLKAQREVLFIVWQGSKLAGCVFAREERSFVYLGKLAVAAEHRGFGYAHSLMEQVESFARKRKLSFVELETRVELVENQRFFENAGYYKIAENAHAGFTRPTSYRYRKHTG